MGKTFTSAPRCGASIQRVISAESFTGTVFGMGQTEVNPPAAAAAVPVAIVSLCDWPGLAQMHMQIDQSGRDDGAARVQRLLRLAAQFARRGNLRDASVAQQDIHLLIDAAGRIDDAPALYQQDSICLLKQYLSRHKRVMHR